MYQQLNHYYSCHYDQDDAMFQQVTFESYTSAGRAYHITNPCAMRYVTNLAMMLFVLVLMVKKV